MVESFRRIENPWLKTTVYASMGFAISTILTGAVIGFINPKNKDLNKLAVCSSLLGITAGSVLSYVLKDKEKTRESEAKSTQTIAKVTDRSWQDWR
ncbi:MAG: oxidoreductase, partial [Cyanobacteriota bacterium]|nr:oxidoreductase [Cyanobacteriota bacterium]